MALQTKATAVLSNNGETATKKHFSQFLPQYKDGQRIKVTGTDTVQFPDKNGIIANDATHFAVFTTEKANAYIFLNGIVNPTKLDRHGRNIVGNGTFEKLVRKVYEEADDNDTMLQIAQEVVKQLNGKELIVKVQFYEIVNTYEQIKSKRFSSVLLRCRMNKSKKK